jgi:hypothetical protein
MDGQGDHCSFGKGWPVCRQQCQKHVEIGGIEGVVIVGGWRLELGFIWVLVLSLLVYSGWDDSEVGLGFIRKLYISMHLSRKLLSREIVAGLDRKV